MAKNVKLDNTEWACFEKRLAMTYALTAQEETKVPLGIAVGMLGDSGLIVEFTIQHEAE